MGCSSTSGSGSTRPRSATRSSTSGARRPSRVRSSGRRSATSGSTAPRPTSPRRRRTGSRICLGADWSPSGSKSLLGELKVADLHIAAAKLTKQFPAQAICAMATCNPADALGWDQQLGRLRKGLHGDFLVLPDARQGPVHDADPRDRVRDPARRDQRLPDVRNRRADEGRQRRQPRADRRDAVAEANDHADRRADSRRRHALAAGARPRSTPRARIPAPARERALARDHTDTPRVTLRPDKPWDDPEELGNEQLLAAVAQTAIPPIDSLTPDDAYFAAIAAEKIHGGQLDGLAGYYK